MVNIETRLLNDNVYEFGLQKVDGGMTTLKEMGYKYADYRKVFQRTIIF